MEEYFVEFFDFDESIQECLREKFLDHLFSINSDNIVALHDDDKADSLSQYQRIHIFREFNPGNEDNIPFQSRKIRATLHKNHESFSVMMFRKEKNGWRRILNAGSFGLPERDNASVCNAILWNMIFVSYK